MKEESGELFIRASQGHTISEIDEEGLMRQITDPAEFPFIVHGTSTSAWNQIRETGLNKMNRNHVHFAIGMPGENEVISGARVNCTVFIEVNMAQAMSEGM
jgi:2'-phosphotransferase